MAKKIKDLAVVVGTYMVNGDEKRRYMNCGAVMEGDDGNQFLMLNRFINYSALPRKQGSDALLISMFDIKERDNSASSGGAQQSSSYTSDLDDDVPF